MHGSPPPSIPFLCPFSSAGLMSITVALVDASLLSLRRAIKNGRGAIRDGTRSSRRQRRIALVLVASVRRACFVTLRSVICSPEQKMFPVAAPSPASSLYTLFTPWRQVVRYHPVPGHGRGDPVNPRTSTYGVVALSFCTLERRRSGDWRTRGRKKIYTKTVPKTVALSPGYKFFDRSAIDFPLKVKKLNEKKDFNSF